jgi:hypothetical protein
MPGQADADLKEFSPQPDDSSPVKVAPTAINLTIVGVSIGKVRKIF